MKDKHAIKNMEYWKKKNNIPGIEALDMAGLTDGRAKSSAFQMATPNSPIKFIGGLNTIFPGLGGNKEEEGPKELLEGTGKTVEEVTGFKVSGGDDDVIAGATGDENIAQPVAEDPNSSLTMRKSPMKQEKEEERIYVGGTYEVGDLVSEDDLEDAFKREGNDPKDYPQLSVQDYSEIKEDENGMYVILQEGGPNQGIESPPEPQIPQGMGPGGMDIPIGGVGPMEMQSPTKIYKKKPGDRTKYIK